MRYIARWVPVEGEIKPGDHGLTETHGYVFKALKETMSLCKGKQKVKLFLCSRDIQVGDKVLHIPSNKYIDVKYQSVLDSMKEKGQLDNYVKVIGEISPDATWVKEGDEFDSSELLATSHGLQSVRKRIEDFKKEDFPLHNIWVVGHFH